jgi:patatin-like phospholipase/acyl hydrolase
MSVINYKPSLWKVIKKSLLLYSLCLTVAGHALENIETKESSIKSSIHNTPKKRKLIKILSIDGGGIRGIIPALILKEIENKLKNKKHLSQCFDVMAGNSTGGIIILLLNTPGTDGKPRYRSRDIVSFYHALGPTVFYQSWWQYLSTFNGWLSEKYSSESLEKNMARYFGESRLRNAFTNIIIPAYEISKDDTVFFKSDKAQLDVARDFYLKDIARATSAAPTYFKPANIQDFAHQKTYTLVDGGVAVNNPTMSACVYALKLFGRDNDFLVVSIGTGTNYGAPSGKLSYQEKTIKGGGKIDWASDIVSMMMNAANEVVDYQMAEIFISDDGKKNYYRFQVLLDPKHTALDNTSPENIGALEQYALALIKENQQEITKLVAILDAD